MRQMAGGEFQAPCVRQRTSGLRRQRHFERLPGFSRVYSNGAITVFRREEGGR